MRTAPPPSGDGAVSFPRDDLVVPANPAAVRVRRDPAVLLELGAGLGLLPRGAAEHHRHPAEQPGAGAHLHLAADARVQPNDLHRLEIEVRRARGLEGAAGRHVDQPRAAVPLLVAAVVPVVHAETDLPVRERDLVLARSGDVALLVLDATDAVAEGAVPAPVRAAAPAAVHLVSEADDAGAGADPTRQHRGDGCILGEEVDSS